MPNGRRLIERVIAALRLQLPFYLDVSADAAASRQAFVVVLLSGVSNGMGLVSRLGGAGISAGVGAAVLGWLLWTAVVFVVALPFGRRQAGRSLLRALGFGTAPGLFLIAGSVPILGTVVRVVVVPWLVAATVLAVQAVYDMSRWRAVLVAVVAFMVYLVLGAVSAYLAAG
jgi:hypothetical protein